MDPQMNISGVRSELIAFLRFHFVEAPVPFTTHEVAQEAGYRRILINYAGDEGDRIPAYLLLPHGAGPFAAVLVHHQHAGQRHLGKSEVVGLVGDPVQAFGPALASRGIAVLAPDSICFEDRRRNQSGTEADEEADVEQHYNEMCYRILRGDTLMRKVLDDSARAISLLQAHPQIDAGRVGILGHSYGGNTVLFHAPLDERIRFACSSGAASSYRYKMTHHFGIEMAEVIPGFAMRFDIADLLLCMTPRPMLLLSANEDPSSQDAPWLVRTMQNACASMGLSERIEHKHYQGKHALTQERFDTIVHWLVSHA
jgi:dienelactone hydrolase